MMGSKPARIPLFPLAGAILLPRAQLPLHIFEPRYREMVRDALAGQGRIGMIQPRPVPGENGGLAEPVALFPVGCLGEIVAAEELDDGRFNIVLHGSSRFRLIAERELYRGTLNRAAVEPRLVLKEGLLAGAAALIVFHTHPSGDPTPSPEDLAFTRRLGEAGEVVGIRVVDHLILGGVGRWVSLAERGGW